MKRETIKAIKRRKRNAALKRLTPWLYLLASLLFLAGILMSREREYEILSPVDRNYRPEPQQEPEPQPEKKTSKKYMGKASYYSDAGCLDCRDDRIMANGELFDENGMTLAIGIIAWTEDGYGIPQIPLNTKVLVTNTTNGRTAIARVTDTGGFNTPEYGNRIADLSKELARVIELRTDQVIELEVLE